jgi:hypothetical protein
MERQLDIFDDSRDLALRNDIAQALLRGDLRAAKDSAATLRAEFGDDPALAPAAVLVEHLRGQAAAAPNALPDVAAVLERRQRIAIVLSQAASGLMGPVDARAWLARQWRALARAAQPLPWQPDQPEAHAASLYLQAGDWADAAEAVRGIASWRRIPQPLLWMVEARWHLQGADAAWPLLAEALWLAPGRARALLARLPDKPLARLVRRFEDEFEPGDDRRGDCSSDRDWAWLPAFALVDQPALAEVLAGANSDADAAAIRGFRLAAALLRLERAGRHHDIVEHRRQLKALDERLFALYMRTR